MDISFVVDGSGSVSPESFRDAISFIKKVVENLPIGPEKVHIGAVEYSSQPRV